MSKNNPREIDGDVFDRIQSNYKEVMRRVRLNAENVISDFQGPDWFVRVFAETGTMNFCNLQKKTGGWDAIPAGVIRVEPNGEIFSGDLPDQPRVDMDQILQNMLTCIEG